MFVFGKDFGEVVEDHDAKASYARGTVVEVQFWAGHPKNDPMTQSSYLEVQRHDGQTWQPVAHDWDWETTFRWRRHGIASSIVTITWTIPPWIDPGTYRILHRGARKTLTQKIEPYQGTSSEFQVQ